MKSFFKWSGKADRFEWWAVTLITGVAGQLAILYLAFSHFDGSGGIGLSISLVIAALVTLWLTFAATVRRLRDCGYSPWFVLLGCVPVLCCFVVAVCGFVPGKAMRNRKLVKRVVK
ncbi:DUF805 domain-containing protein [Verrucomicrobiaceae bacterium N1E253]|uniref:DUF805 domain-containing protein n=1 Tax=Oceaniferula marina TaxID=2748318 RepID=A0A851GK65_9BACT|nr:DUF805 domain-containing protein [Oceaniferula marina]NWK55487.1 DUF805 domain-containing protein [Oceaniferula marina]